MMAMDSEKHARLLNFVQDRLQARSQAEKGGRIDNQYRRRSNAPSRV